ncbi:hypothetical protein HZS_3574 [Henneguya salminicola]|nr:hypothetical protein HZS_3574 [Henneguya salminicola]
MNVLVKQGRTICCTIHQPSARIFELFEKVIVLANGSILYSGLIKDMVNYFGTLNLICPKYHNPADFKVSSGYYGVKVEYLCEKWRSSEFSDTNNISINDSSNPLRDISVRTENVAIELQSLSTCNSIEKRHRQSNTFFTMFSHEILQFGILTKRSLRASFRDKMFTYLRFATTIVMSLLLGTLYYDIGNDGANVINNLGCIFFTMIYLIFICLMPTVLTFPLEKNVFIREHLNNWYTLKAYYLAKTFSDLPYQIILPIIYCVIMYYMTGQPLNVNRMFLFMLVIIMAVMVSQSIGLLLGAVAPNTSVAVFVAPVTGIPLLLFCGYFIKYSVIPVYLRWFTYISYARYCWEGAILSLYGDNRGSFQCKTAPCMFNDGEEVLAFFDITEDAMGIKKFRLWFCIIILMFFFVILRMLTYIVLRAAISNRKK